MKRGWWGNSMPQTPVPETNYSNFTKTIQIERHMIITDHVIFVESLNYVIKTCCQP